MRKSSLLDALFPRTRQKVLATLMPEPDQWWYLSGLADSLGLRPSSLQKELAALAHAGVLHSRRDGNRVYYQPDPSCPILPELRGLMRKATGLTDVLLEVLLPHGASVDVAFVFGSFARGEETGSSDVDLMVIGELRLAEVTLALREAERSIGRRVNAAFYPAAEFAVKLQAGHHFLRAVLNDARLFVVGDENGLAAIVGGTAGTRAHDDESGA